MTILLLTVSLRPSGLWKIAFLKILPGSTCCSNLKPRPRSQCFSQQGSTCWYQNLCGFLQQLIKHHHLVACNNRRLLSCRCGSRKSKFEVQIRGAGRCGVPWRLRGGALLSLPASGGSRLPWADGRLPPGSVSVLTSLTVCVSNFCLPQSCKDTRHWIWVHQIIQNFFISRSLTISQKILFLRKAAFAGSGLGCDIPFPGPPLNPLL